jgi:hypothetical protein
LTALERLLNEIDERLTVPIFKAFKRIFAALIDQPDIIDQLAEQNSKEGFQRVRKVGLSEGCNYLFSSQVVVTPTRLLFVVPELMMGNRVLRKFDTSGEHAIRVQFRDDDGTQLRRFSVGDFLINLTVGGTLEHGLTICGELRPFFKKSICYCRTNIRLSWLVELADARQRLLLLRRHRRRENR